MKPILRFRNPNARVKQWECAEGERALLVAPSGWGKTIWLKQLSLLRDAAATEIQWRGEVVGPARAAQYRSRWIYVPQSAVRSRVTIAEHFTTLGNLAAIENHLGKDPSFADRVVDEFPHLGLARPDVHKRLVSQLSGGEIQSMALIRSVLLAPEGLFLDEPTSAMDRNLSLRAEKWILEKYRGAFVWVSHDEAQRERLAKAGAREIPIS